MSFKEDYSKFTSYIGMSAWGLFWKVLSIMIVLSVIFGIVGFVGGWFGAVKKVIEPQNVIYNYKWFKDQVAAIQQLDERIKSSKQEMKDFKELYGNAQNWGWQQQE
ncbi:MAG: hypothetical protein AABY22_23885, partial [Nanoarchaeota archaeon]